MTSDLNRRQSVRVTDRAMLAYRRITPERFDAIVKDFQDGISIYNQEHLADIQMFISAQNALARLRERGDADLADFLQQVDNKVNLLLKRTSGEKSPFDDLKLQKVSLSSTGMAFSSRERLEPGDIVELHLVLLPDYTYIYCFARVINSEPLSDQPQRQAYRVGVEFVLITDDDREKLVQHNFRQQSLALRNRRQRD